MLKFRRDGKMGETTAKKYNDVNASDKAGEDKYWLKLESSSERRSRLRSIYIVHGAMLVFALGYSIILTGVLPYLKRLTSLSDHEVRKTDDKSFPNT